VQIQTLITGEIEAAVAEGSNIGFNIEVAKLPVFNREVRKVEGFITVYRLYLKI